MSLEQAAMVVIRIAYANMINALKLVSVRRGYDPRDFVLIVFGGGGPMHAGALMRERRVNKVITPTEPAVFSAWGMLMTDLRRDYIRTLITRTDQVEPKRLNSIYLEMEDLAMQVLAAEGVQKGDMLIERFADMRYSGQEHTVKVRLPGGKISEEEMPQINERFHTQHEQTYTFRLETPVELVNYHITALGRVKKPAGRKIDSGRGETDG